MSRMCSECIACEMTEYINPFHVTPICHQGSMVVRDLSLAERCECFEPKDNMEVADNESNNQGE